MNIGEFIFCRTVFKKIIEVFDFKQKRPTYLRIFSFAKTCIIILTRHKYELSNFLLSVKCVCVCLNHNLLKNQIPFHPKKQSILCKELSFHL